MSHSNEGPDRIDYQETPDVTEVHAAVEREKPEPSAEVTPLPLWLTGVTAFAVCWAAIYFGIFNGGLSGNVFNEYESSPAVLFPLPAKEGGAVVAEKPKTLAEQGAEVYAQCQVCHQPTGHGRARAIPAAGQIGRYVNGGDKRMVAIMLKGLQGSVNVEGKTFNGAMPAWEAVLTPKKIAAVASYVRSSFGNTAPEVTGRQSAGGEERICEARTARGPRRRFSRSRKTPRCLMKVAAQGRGSECGSRRAAPAALRLPQPQQPVRLQPWHLPQPVERST